MEGVAALMDQVVEELIIGKGRSRRRVGGKECYVELSMYPKRM